MWRTALGEPAAGQPLLDEGQLYVPLASGALVKVDLQSGAASTRLQFSQPISGPVALLDGTHLVVHFFTILFEYLPGIAQFQVVQREPAEIVARIVPAPDCDRPAIERKVREDVARATHGTLAVRFEYVQDIPLSPSMKRRFVISDVRPASSSSAAGAAAAR